MAVDRSAGNIVSVATGLAGKRLIIDVDSKAIVGTMRQQYKGWYASAWCRDCAAGACDTTIESTLCSVRLYVDKDAKSDCRRQRVAREIEEFLTLMEEQGQ
jgi:hypothetical protein